MVVHRARADGELERHLTVGRAIRDAPGDPQLLRCQTRQGSGLLFPRARAAGRPQLRPRLLGPDLGTGAFEGEQRVPEPAPGLPQPSPSPQPLPVQQQGAGPFEVAARQFVPDQGVLVQRLGLLRRSQQGAAARELGGCLRIRSLGRPHGELLDRRGGVLRLAGEHGGLDVAGHREHAYGEVATPVPRPHQRTQPGGGVGGPAASQIGPCASPFGERGGLGESVLACDGQGGFGMCGDRFAVPLDRCGQSQDGVVMGDRVAPAGAVGGAQPLLGVGPCAGVPSGAQLGVGEMFEDLRDEGYEVACPRCRQRTGVDLARGGDVPEDEGRDTGPYEPRRVVIGGGPVEYAP